ncbi:ABC transporter permease [bacterium]|nr:ABC transporter permease [bacterium]
MKNFWQIVKAEWKKFLKDSGATLVMIIGVIGYSLFYAIPYSTEVVKEAPVGVVDYDNTNLSRIFTRNLNTSDSLKVVFNPVSKQDAEKQFYQNKIKGFIIIPKDFEKDVLRGRQSTVELFADSGYMIIYKALYMGTVQTAMSLGAKIEIGKLMKSGMSKQMAISMKQSFEFVQIPLYNAAGGYETYVYPSILVMILHQTLIVGLGLMQGTRNELKERYCDKKEDVPLVLFARCTHYVLLYLFYSLIIFLVFPAVFVYPMAYNLLPLFALLIPMYYAAAFFAHSISYFFKTRESALLVLVVTSLVFIFLPGFIWPKESIPLWVNGLAEFIPATSGIDGIIKINQMNGTFWNVRYDFLWLIFLCILYFNLAVFSLKKAFNK